MLLEAILQKTKNYLRGTLVAGILSSALLISCGGGGGSPPQQQPPKNRAPAITSSAITTANENSYYEYRVQASDPDGDPIAYALSEAPSWLSVTSNIVYGNTPEVSKDTIFPVRIRVYDQANSTAQAYNLTVKNLFNTYVLSSDQSNSITAINDSAISFSQPVDFLVKDIIASGISDKTPSGILREVTSVSSDRKTVGTAQAALEQTVRNGSLSFSQSLLPSNIQSFSAKEGVSLLLPNMQSLSVKEGISIAPPDTISGFDFNIDLSNVVLYDKDGNLNTTSDQVIANGNISFSTICNLNVNIIDFTMKDISFQNQTTDLVDVSIGSNLLGLATSHEIKLAEYNFQPIVIGFLPTTPPIPVVVVPKLAVYVGLDLSKVNPLSMRVKQDANLTARLIYDSGLWTSSSTFANNFDFFITNPTGEWDLRSYAGPRLSLLLYGVAGPWGSVNSGLRLESVSGDWKLYGGLEAKLGIEMDVFKKVTASFSKTIIDYEKLLAEKGTPGTGGKILFTSTRDGNAEVYMMNSDGSSQQNLTKNSSHDYEAAWSSDRSKIVFVSERDGNPEIYTMNLDGTNPRRLTYSSGSSNNVDRMPDWSHDGRDIVFYSDRNGNDEIFLMNPDGTNQRKLNLPFATHIQPKWCAGQIIFSSTLAGEGHLDVYKVNRDATGLQRLTTNIAADVEPCCSFDGSKIAFSSDRINGYYDIWVMNSDGSNPANLSNTTYGIYDMSPSWSPDGQRISYAFGSFSRAEIYVMNADGSNKTKITDNPFYDNRHPVW